MKTVRLASLCAALALLANVASAQDKKPADEKAAVKTIDVAICLDCSGSMQGLIDSAKVKLWDIINELARIKPSPKLRVALYSYGDDSHDANAGWIRKEIDLTSDLDALYQKLFALRATGSTEYVTRVCRDAVRDLAWSEGKGALKIVFVCGNEPASQDPTVSLQEAAKVAKSRNVIINAIYAGDAQSGEARDWIQFAELCGGRFSSIDQQRGTVAIATPVDKKLAELGVQLNSTYIAFGKAGDAKKSNQMAQTANAQQAGLGVAAARTATQNSVYYNCADWDLVDRCKMDAKFDVTKLAVDELPDVMKKMTVQERVAHVKKMTDQRAALQKDIDDLNVQRLKFISDEQKRNPNPGDRAFDQAIRETLRIQAETQGIIIPKE